MSGVSVLPTVWVTLTVRVDSCACVVAVYRAVDLELTAISTPFVWVVVVVLPVNWTVPVPMVVDCVWHTPFTEPTVVAPEAAVNQAQCAATASGKGHIAFLARPIGMMLIGDQMSG